MLRNSPLQASKVSPLEKQHDMAQRLTRCGGTFGSSASQCYAADAVRMRGVPKYTVDGPRSVVLPPVVMVDTSCATHRSGNTGGVGSASAREAMPADASPSKIMVDMFYPKFCKIFIICSHLGTR